MEVEGINYIEALKYLAGKYGIEVEEEEMTDEQIQAQNKRDSLFIVLNFAAEYFKETLFNSDQGKSIGLSYFKERGFTESTIQKFGLGYTLDEWDGLLKAATGKGHTEEMLLHAGLILKNENGKIYDRFRSRVVFPIHNIVGKVIAFGARTTGRTKRSRSISTHLRLKFTIRVISYMVFIKPGRQSEIKSNAIWWKATPM